LPGNAGFLGKPGNRQVILAVFVPQALDRHPPPNSLIEYRIDAAHSPESDPLGLTKSAGKFARRHDRRLADLCGQTQVVRLSSFNKRPFAVLDH